jgi:hypothetical protein
MLTSLGEAALRDRPLDLLGVELPLCAAARRSRGATGPKDNGGGQGGRDRRHFS